MGKHEKQEKKKGGFFRGLLKLVVWLLVIVIVLVGGMIGFLSATEFKPGDVETAEIAGQANGKLKSGAEMTVMSWNIGYGALGDNADFFMDGGTSVYTADEERVESNMDGIIDNIGTSKPDIAFIQEIDQDSSRSHHTNEYEMLQTEFPDYCTSFANNFKVAYLPYPIPPMGKVDSGIATFSKYQADSAERIQLPIPFTWPMRMANLKRCLLVERIPVAGSDKELVLVNLHLEAYDSGEGKVAQTKQLAELLNQEYEKGNYVIAGGDFNQIFSSEDYNAFAVKEGMWSPGIIDVSTIPGKWNFLMDEKVPSCRSLDQPYAGSDKDNFQYYLIDGFITSGNIDVKSCVTQDLGFKNSDHNPVLMKIKLK